MLTSEVEKGYKPVDIYFNKKWFSVLKIVDKMLSLIYNIFKQLRSKKIVSYDYRSILILESHLIGDVIMGLPAYRVIRENFPNATMIFWGNKWGKELLSEQQLFDKFIIAQIPWAVYNYSFSTFFSLLSQVIRLRKLKIDLAFEFRGDIRNIFLLYLIGAKRRISYNFTGGTYWLTDIAPPPESLHIIDRNLNLVRMLGVKIRHSLPKLHIPLDKLEIAKKYLDEKVSGRKIFIHPGASQRKRLWAPEKFALVVDFLYENGYMPVLISGPQDKDLIHKIQNKCKLKPYVLSVPLRELPAYLSLCEIFIGTDSGVAHIAAALGKNMIVLFGPQLPLLTAPKGDGNIRVIIKNGFECRPCSGSLCKHNNNACMEAIELEDVKIAIQQLMALKEQDKCKKP
jgi:ADP-heptose:LPS heptosyltransferase